MDKIPLIFFLLILICFVVVYLFIFVQEKPGRGWLIYPIILSLLPIYFNLVASGSKGPGTKHNYIIAFVPIVVLAIATFQIWLMKRFILFRNGRLEKGPVLLQLLIFLVASFLSLINANDIPAGLVMIAAWGFIIFLYIALYNTIEDKNILKQFTYLYIGVTVCLAIAGMLSFEGEGHGFGANAFHSESESFLEKNHLAFILEESFFSAFLISISRSFSKKIRIYSFGCFLVLLAGIIFSLSRGGWIGCVGGFVVLPFFLKTRGGVKVKIAVVLLFVAVMSFLAFSNVDLLHSRLMSLDDDQNFPRRIPMLMAGIKAFLDHPFIGVGIRNFIEYHFFEYVPSADLLYFNRPMGVNNLYIRILAETGSLGFLALVWIFGVILKEVAASLRAAPQESQDHVFLAGFLAGFVANLIHFNFLDLIYPIPWVFFFFGITMTKFYRVKSKEVPQNLIKEGAYVRF